MDAKHTPGPWFNTFAYERHWVQVGKGKKAVRVADVSVVEKGDEEDQFETLSNARLIAAAPDLLAACEQLIEVLGLCGGGTAEVEREIRRAGAAVAKAKGGAN